MEFKSLKKGEFIRWSLSSTSKALYGKVINNDLNNLTILDLSSLEEHVIDISCDNLELSKKIVVIGKKDVMYFLRLKVAYLKGDKKKLEDSVKKKIELIDDKIQKYYNVFND